MLTKVFDFIRVMCCQYWPMEEHKPDMYGPVEVTLLSEEHLADFVIRTIRIRKPGQMVSGFGGGVFNYTQIKSLISPTGKAEGEADQAGAEGSGRGE